MFCNAHQQQLVPSSPGHFSLQLRSFHTGSHLPAPLPFGVRSSRTAKNPSGPGRQDNFCFFRPRLRLFSLKSPLKAAGLADRKPLLFFHWDPLQAKQGRQRPPLLARSQEANTFLEGHPKYLSSSQITSLAINLLVIGRREMNIHYSQHCFSLLYLLGNTLLQQPEANNIPNLGETQQTQNQ